MKPQEPDLFNREQFEHIGVISNLKGKTRYIEDCEECQNNIQKQHNLNFKKGSSLFYLFFISTKVGFGYCSR